MADILLSSSTAPYVFSIILLLGFLALEVLMSLVGISFFGGSDQGDVDFDADFDLGGELDADFDADFDVDADLDFEPDFDPGADMDAVEIDGPVGVLAWLGLGKVPMAILIGSILAGFGISGLAIHALSQAVIGTGLPQIIVFPAATFAGLWFTSKFSGVFARLLPKTETAATSSRFLGGRPGVVTQGTARRGKPAEVRVTDRHGNTHYIRAEPLEDEAEIGQGSDVFVIRLRDKGFRLIASTD